MPGVQKPHWSAACRVKTSSSRSKSGRSASPSIVRTSEPAASAARKQQELTGSPSTSTVHEPQTCTSHERLAPVSPSPSRSTSSSSSCGSTSRTNSWPLTLSAICTGHLALPRLPVLGDELVPVLHRQQSERQLRADRPQLPERRGDRLQACSALERHSRQHRPRNVLADREDAVVLHQQRAPRPERRRDAVALLLLHDQVRVVKAADAVGEQDPVVGEQRELRG